MEEILDILNHSFGYVDYMNTCTDMIESGLLTSSLAKLSKQDRRNFYLRKREIKSRLEEEWIRENPDEIIRTAKELILIDNIKQDDKLRSEFEKLMKTYLKYIKKQIKGIKQKENFDKRLNQLI